MNQQNDLFTASPGFLSNSRPKSFTQIIGQESALSKITPLLKNLSAHFIFFGSPGCGKTSICSAIKSEINYPVQYYNPVTQTLSELKKINADMYSEPYVLFVDEIHRMDKKQQEFLLPYLENGSFKLIATTTENPYTFFTRAILSRVITIELTSLDETAIEKILVLQKKCDPNRAKIIAALNLHDARKAILIFEQTKHLSIEELNIALKDFYPEIVYDKTRHYDLLSALIKSMRSSDVEEANQWLACLINEGGDLMTICRRLMIFASEDIGEGAPYALIKAVACTQAVEKIGMPEAQIILGDTVSFLASSKKSRINDERIKKHIQLAREKFIPIPSHRRNR